MTFPASLGRSVSKAGTDAPPLCAGCGAVGGEAFVTSGNYTIYRCRRCTLGFLWPQPSDGDLETLYGADYFGEADGITAGYSSYLDQSANLLATFRDRLTFVPPPHPGARLLDVGAAAGHFVSEARRSGWHAEGVEFSAWAAEYARTELKVPVRTGTLESGGFEDESFDAVTMWEVIEHLPDPKRVLAEAQRVLRPGGMLHLSTPDAGSLVARLAGRRWLGWRKIPEHLFYFDLPSLQRMLGESGFEVVDHRYVSLTVTWAYAMERLGSMLGARWLGRLPRGIATRPLRVNCYYDLMVSARRREG